MSELDAEVAREVMGWILDNDNGEPDLDEYGEPVAKGPTWLTKDDAYTGWHDWNWFPSEDATTAFVVVAEMQRKGWRYGVMSHEVWETGTVTHGAMFYMVPGDAQHGTEYSATADTPAEAIAHAALAAVRARG